MKRYSPGPGLSPVLCLTLCILVASLGFALDVDEIIDLAEAPFTVSRVYSVSEMNTYEGDTLDRQMVIESYSLSQDDVSQSLVIYTDPVRMRGTAYLTVGNDLWVRFGSTGRVRKLSSSAKSDSASGTDFSYEDMGEGSGGISESYAARLLAESARFDGIDCYQIELAPLPGSESAYGKLIAYISHDNFRYIAIEYFESGAHTKTLVLTNYRRVGAIDYPFRVAMQSLTRGTRTEIIVNEIEFNSDDVRDSMFTVSYLERLR